jgi:hypothetical protein
LSIDLGSPVIDIAVALSFIFFLLSVIASSVTEAIAWALNLRAKTLKKGLEGMLGDKGFVEKLFAHPLIRTELLKQPAFAKGIGGEEAKGLEGKERGPSYISPQNFVGAFKAEVATAPEATTRQLEALGLDPKHLTEADETLEQWFEGAMERVNGWYKRQSQKITVVIALVVAIGLNASTVRIVEHLDKEPTVRTAVVAQAEAAAQEKTTTKAAKETSLEAAGEGASSAYDKLGALKIPIFWAKENIPQNFLAGVVALVGCLLTAIAISLGAPFWFDTLGKLANLRMAGKKPESESNPKAGAPVTD